MKGRGSPHALAIALVVAASTYVLVLCFLNTHVMGVSNGGMAIVDGAIVLSALALALRGASRWLWIFLAALAVNFLLLTLLSDNLNLKAIRDPLLLAAFAALGLRYGSIAHAQAAFLLVCAIVLGFAAFEFLAPEAYTGVFNVIRFYTARGVVDADSIQYLDSAFFVSGARAGERMLFPELGAHRVSSIFLEPVSMGNFGALAIAFALSLGRAQWRTAAAVGAVGLAAIVLADARFASMAVILFIIVRLLPRSWMRIALPFLPLVALGVLVGFALSDVGAGDDLPTRLAGSGRTLLGMSPVAAFGLAPYAVTAYDSGYAYAFSAFGLPFSILLWAAFILLPTPSKPAERFKLLLGVYICALLCISGSSLFALKTAGLAFFVLGGLAATRPAIAFARHRPTSSMQGAPA